MKKIKVLALTVVLVLAMNAVVFAAGSPNTNIEPDGKVEVDGKEVSVYVNNVVNNDAVTSKENVDKIALEAVKAATGNSNTEVKGTLMGAVVDITLAEGVQPSEENPVTIRIKVQGATASDVIIAAHQKHDGVWEYLPTTTGEGTVTITFTSLSPVAFIKVPADAFNTNEEEEYEEEEEEEEEEAAQPATSVSPKTGDDSAVVLLGVIAVSMAGACICVRRVGKVEQ